MSLMAFDRDRGGRGRSFGGRDSGGGRRFDRRPTEMTQVTCSNCGRETEVPFRPTGDRPVYCRDCFAKMGGGENRRSFGRGSNDSRPRQSSGNNNAQLSEINAKLDQLIKLLTPKGESKAVEQVPQEEKSEEAPVVKKKRVVKKAAAETPSETPSETPQE